METIYLKYTTEREGLQMNTRRKCWVFFVVAYLFCSFVCLLILNILIFNGTPTISCTPDPYLIFRTLFTLGARGGKIKLLHLHLKSSWMTI